MSIKPLDILIQTTIPTVYQRGMSFYEVLASVVAKVNENVDAVNEFTAQNLASYVETTLQTWYDDGTLGTLINGVLLSDINDKIGSQAYTEQNYITDGEPLSDSLDALDMGLQAIQGDLSTWLNVRDYGATGDGVTDDSAAFIACITAAANSSSLYGNFGVRIPKGDYVIKQNNVFGNIPYTLRGGIYFKGDGWASTTIRLSPVADPLWLYDNTSGFQRFQFCVFEGIGIRSTNAALAGAFKIYSTGHEQGMKFYNCWFEGLHTCFKFDGVAGNSEYKFYGCKFAYIEYEVFELNCSQSVNLELFGCDVEDIFGDVFYINQAGGGSIKTYGGSYILNNTNRPTEDKFILRINDISAAAIGTGNCDYTFMGMKTELRSVYSKLVKYNRPEGLGLISFIACNLTTTSGGDREAVLIAQNKQVYFDKCFIPGEFKYRITGGTENTGHGGTIQFNRCMIPTELYNFCTIDNSYGTYKADDCVGSLESLTDTIAVNFDYNWQNRVRTDSDIKLKTVTLKPSSIAFPYGGSGEVIVYLPPNAMIIGLFAYKPASGASGSTYQLHLGNSDKSLTYGSSTEAAQAVAHSISVPNLMKMCGASGVDLGVRLWATGGDSVHVGGYVIVQYI